MVGSLGMTAFAEDTLANEPIDTTVSNYNLKIKKKLKPCSSRKSMK